MTPWTVAHQAPLSMGFSRQEYWSGLYFLLQGIFPTQESNPGLLHLIECKLCILAVISVEASSLPFLVGEAQSLVPCQTCDRSLEILTVWPARGLMGCMDGQTSGQIKKGCP